MTYTLKISPDITSEELNALFESAWSNHTPVDAPVLLSHALFYVCVFDAYWIRKSDHRWRHTRFSPGSHGGAKSAKAGNRQAACAPLY